ncbi:LysR substrate-binding domain-containing protein, partial [Bremerella sp. JC817]
VTLTETASSRTYYIAAALVRAGLGMAIVDNFTAESAVASGLESRPLQPALTFNINAVYLQARPPSRVGADFLDLLASVIDAV